MNTWSLLMSKVPPAEMFGNCNVTPPIPVASFIVAPDAMLTTALEVGSAVAEPTTKTPEETVVPPT